MTKNTLAALIKFGREEHMLDLYHNGTIYMNALSYFREFEKNKNRADKYEGIVGIKQIAWIKLVSQDGKTILEMSRDGNKGGKIINAQLREWVTGLDGNIYCMYAITTDWPNENICIDPRNADFGDGEPTMVVINNVSEIRARFIKKLEELGLKAVGRLVTYYDEEKHEGDIDFFHKSNRFSYQCEYRIFVERKDDADSEPNGAIRFQIGSLHDIASIHKADNLSDIRVVIEGN